MPKSLTLDNGTGNGDLAFQAAKAITVDGCMGGPIRLMQNPNANEGCPLGYIFF